jgi:hypothetical protein
MTETFTFSPDEVMPTREAVFENQGIPPGITVSGPADTICEHALALLASTAAPAGITGEISADDFGKVYEGVGRNDPETPVGGIFERADHLALFTVTIGERPGEEIARLFDENDFALAAMLDSAASAAAENAAELAERRYGEVLRGERWGRSDGGVLRYSPGYCGWHVSGQRKLFDHLGPEKIGVTLTNSFLMQPLKSVSGVIIAAHRDVHKFAASYPFCRECKTHECRDRIRALFAE